MYNIASMCLNMMIKNRGSSIIHDATPHCRKSLSVPSLSEFEKPKYCREYEKISKREILWKTNPFRLDISLTSLVMFRTTSNAHFLIVLLIFYNININKKVI